MTTLEPTVPTALPVRLAPALYAATIFMSALLLVLVQPMFTKMVLPQLGGAPQVWSVAMVFFQAALLAGYLSRLEPGGVLLLIISNRYMDVGPVAAPVGASEGLVTWLKQDSRPDIVPPDFKFNALPRRLRAILLTSAICRNGRPGTR